VVATVQARAPVPAQVPGQVQVQVRALAPVRDSATV